VNCRQIDEFLNPAWTAPRARFPPAVAEHLRLCPACRQLVQWVQTGASYREVPYGLRKEIEKSLVRSLQPVRPLPSARVVAAVFAVFVALILAVGASFKGIRSPGVQSASQLFTIGLILAAGSALLAGSLSRQLTPGALYRIPPRLLVFSILMTLSSGFVLLFPWRPDPTFWSWGWSCFRYGSLWTILTAIGLWLLVRRGAILSPVLTGATAGLLAGFTGAAIIHLGCLNVTAPHLAIWHAAVPAAGALAGLLLGTAWERRARP